MEKWASRAEKQCPREDCLHCLLGVFPKLSALPLDRSLFLARLGALEGGIYFKAVLAFTKLELSYIGRRWNLA